MIRPVLAAAVTAIVFAPSLADAQRRQPSIEIIGQVPTPQVVTVRPREVPNYDRRVLVPTFYDHDFWQSILPGYLLVRQRVITGTVPGDSATVRRDTTGVVPPASAQPVQTPPPGGATPPPPAAATGQPAAPPGLPRSELDAQGEDARRVPPRAGSPALPPR